MMGEKKDELRYEVKVEELVFLLFYSIECIFKEEQGHGNNS